MASGAASTGNEDVAEHFIVHFPRGRSWASLLVEAFAQRRIDSELMWEILLAHADEIAAEPDIANLLDHLKEDIKEAGRAPLPSREMTRRDSGDDWFVMDEDDAA